MQDQLKSQVVKGTKWAFFSSIFVRALQMITAATLAKLLMPAEFGVFTLATIVTNALIIFPESGFAQALIYQQGNIKRTANTALILSTATSAALAAVLFFSAPTVGWIFNTPQIVMPTRIMALTVIMAGMTSVPTALLDKELMFKRRAFADVAGWTTYAVLSIVLAVKGYGVWSMVIGWTALSIVNMIVIWIVCPWRPTIEFRMDESRVIVSYGKHLVLGVLAAFVFLQIDKAAVGKWLGVTALGFYGLAFTVCSLPATNLTSVVNRVMFPAYSKLHDNLDEIRSIYLRTVKHLSVVAFFAAVGMMVLPGPLIRVFYGPKWEPAIPLFSILAFYGLVRTIGATADSVFMGTGHPIYVQRMRTIQLAIGGGLVYPAAKLYGVMGVASLFTIAYMIGTLYGLAKVQKILGIRTIRWAEAIRWPTAAAVMAGAITWLAASSFVRPSWTAVIVTTMMLSCAYGAFLFLFDRGTYRELQLMISRSKRAGAL